MQCTLHGLPPATACPPTPGFLLAPPRQARSELVAELFDLQSHSAAAAAGSTSGSGRAAASGPLLSEADCEWIGTVASALLFTPSDLLHQHQSPQHQHQQQQQQGSQQQAQQREGQRSAAAAAAAAVSQAEAGPSSSAPAAASPVPAPAYLNGSGSILKTPTPDAQGPGTSSANGSGGAFPSAAANNSGAAAASSGQAQCNAGCVANGMGAGCCDGNGAAGKAAVSSAAAGALLPLQRSLLCPITQLLMRDPVTTAAGHTYERCAIEAWFLNNNTDPTTREPPARLAGQLAAGKGGERLLWPIGWDLGVGGC